MRFLFYALLFVCILTIPTACRKEKNRGGGDQATASKVATIMNTQNSAVSVYRDKWQQTSDTIEALNAMCNWIIAQPDVDKAYFRNMDEIRIHYKNGLWSSINLRYKNSAGMHTTRGGGGAPGQGGYTRTYQVGGQQKGAGGSMKISNKKVLVFAPYFGQFYGYSTTEYPLLSRFDDAPEPLEVTVVTGDHATLDVLKTAKDYGFIILDTHGSVGSFSVYTGAAGLDLPVKPDEEEWTAEEVEALMAEAKNLPSQSVENGELELQTTALLPDAQAAVETQVVHAVAVTYKYVRTLPMLKDAVVFGNSCFSGYSASGNFENNLGAAWMDRGAVTYYGYAFEDGYSSQALNEFCVRMEDSLISNLVRGDSTGIAHLADDVTAQFYRKRQIVAITPDQMIEIEVDGVKEMTVLVGTGITVSLNVPFIFQHFFDPRYSYGCGTFTDSRDTEVYKLACIGDNKWFAQNLRYNAPGSLFAHNDPSKVKEFGRLYNYPVASAGQGSTQGAATIQGICPQGWHIPTEADWEALESALNAGNEAELAVMLQSPSTSWTADPELANPKRNSSGFSALPAGNAFKTSASAPIQYNNNDASFILSTKNTGILSPEGVLSVYVKQAISGGQSASARIGGGQWVNPSQPGLADSYYSCRCVQDK